MRLFEFQAKRLFRANGVPVPNGTLVTDTAEGAGLKAPLVLKAQVLTGGRGKAGGVIMWDGTQDVGSLLAALFAKDIRGEKVHAVLAEERVQILHEYYLSIVVNGTGAVPVLVASAAGGVDIEKVAHETPEKIVKIPLNPLIGPSDYQVRTLAKGIGTKDARGLRKIVDSLWAVFTSCDATLVEVNPLVATPGGFVALDGKMVVDEKAGFRQAALLKELTAEQAALPGMDVGEARADTITYVPLDGNVGLISDGAGTGMLTLDLIRDAGGAAADFCEMGGLTSPQVMYDAMVAVLTDDKVKSLLVVLIGGFNRMDEMAEGIIRYKEERGLSIPIIVRMCGTLEDVGVEMMRGAGLATSRDLLAAVKDAVQAAAGGGN